MNRALDCVALLAASTIAVMPRRHAPVVVDRSPRGAHGRRRRCVGFALGPLLAWGACVAPAETPPTATQQCLPGRAVCSDADPCPRGFFCDKEFDNADGTAPGDGIRSADDPLGCCFLVDLCTRDIDCPVDEGCDVRRGICRPSQLCDPSADGGGQCPQRDGTSAPCCEDDGLCELTDGVSSCVGQASDASACFVAADGRILTSGDDDDCDPAAVLSGHDLQLEAVGTDVNGKLVAHSTFTWAGAGVDAGGVFHAACDSGVCPFTLTATTQNGGASCTGVIDVYASPVLGHRIVVFDAKSGAPLVAVPVAATVGGIPVAGVTDADGAAEFDGDVTALSAFPDDHEWHTIVDPPADVVIATRRLPDPSVVAGVSGTINFDAVHTTGDIKVGLAGTAMKGPLADVDLVGVLGESAELLVDLEGITDPGGELLSIPSGVVVELGSTPTKGDFVAFGAAGTNVLWSIGGQVPLPAVGPLVSEIAGGDVHAGTVVSGLFPLLSRFDHSFTAGLTLADTTRPRCDNGGFTCADADSCDAATGACVTADGHRLPVDTPTWGFQNVEAHPDTLAFADTDVVVPRLPCAAGVDDDGACVSPVSGSPFYAGVVVMVGALIPGVGVVPLGFSAGLDDPDDLDGQNQTDGLVDSADRANGPQQGHVAVSAAPEHDGLEGLPLVTVAFARQDFLDGGDGSALVRVSKGSVDGAGFPAGAFLEPPAGAFTPDDGHVALGPADVGVDVRRVRLDDGAGASWNVWLPVDVLAFDVTELHPVPAAAAARVRHARLESFALGGDGPASYEALFEGEGLEEPRVFAAAATTMCRPGGVCAAP